MSFQAIRDQNVPVRLLQSMLRRKRVPNGLLFWGLSGVGKRTAAVEFAKALNCVQGGDDACDVCLTCQRILKGTHPDVTFVAPLKKSRIIDVETMDMITSMAALSPFESKWRVFIIQEADRMGIPPQNHFLKTLEEPPGNSVFILLTEFPGLLLPTIRSRCQRVRFGTLRPETVTELLRRDGSMPLEQAQSLAAVAQGQMSRALDLAQTDKREIALDIAKRLEEGADPLAVAEEFAKHLEARRQEIKKTIEAEMQQAGSEEYSREDREQHEQEVVSISEALIRRDILEYLYLFQTWYRDALVYSVTQDASRILNHDRLERLQRMRVENIAPKLAAMDRTRLYLERNLKEDRVFRDLFLVLSQ